MKPDAPNFHNFFPVMEYGKPRSVQIATYNCRWNSFVVDDTAWRLIHGHLPELGIKNDPSHARYASQDYLKEMRDWGHRFVHVHNKGSVIIDGERFDGSNRLGYVHVHSIRHRVR
jgi:sugar phosphate isomerase/epimerase